MGPPKEKGVQDVPLTQHRSWTEHQLYPHSGDPTLSDAMAGSCATLLRTQTVLCEEELSDDPGGPFVSFEKLLNASDFGKENCATESSRLWDAPASEDYDHEQDEVNRRHIQASSVKGWTVEDAEILSNMRRREERIRSSWGYLKIFQTEMGTHHRKIMVNWLAEFANVFHLQKETIFLGVAIMDQFLSDLRRRPIPADSLQLLGTACMLVAAKFEEAPPPSMIRDCCEAGEGSFVESQVLLMEAEVLKSIDYNCAIPTIKTFFWYHVKAAGCDPHIARLADVGVNLALLEYNLLQHYPSAISAAAVAFASVSFGRHWGRDIEEKVGYSMEALEPILQVIRGAYHEHQSTVQVVPNN